MPIRPASIARFCGLLVAACSCLGCAGAGSTDLGPATGDVARPAIPRPFVFTEDRIDAVPGRTLVAPVEFPDGLPPGTRGEVRAELSDGRRLPASLAWLSFEPGDNEMGSSAAQWLPAPGDWSVVRAPAAGFAERPAGPGFWVVSVALPADAAGLGLRIGDRIAPIRWIAPAPTLFPADIRPPRRDGLKAPSVELARALLPWSQNPLHRWRVNLLGQRLSFYGVPAALAGPTLDDPLLEALATQTELRWRTALNRLADVDPPVAFGVLERLTLIIRFADGRELPAWPPRSTRLSRLLSDLLDRDISARDATRVARAWLSEQPDFVPWIIDDMGRPLSGGRCLVTGAIANLSSEGREGRIETEAGAARSVAIGARSAQRFETPAPWGLDRVPVVFALGEADAVRPARTAPITVEPPGAVLGPFVAAWTMPEWLAGSPRPASGDEAGAAIMQPQVDGSGWELYLECRTEGDASVGPARADVVRIFIGPTDSPRAILRLDARGVIHDEADPFSQPESIAIHHKEDRWVAQVPIPEEALDRGSDELLIGILRSDRAGRVSSWPRPVLPWSEAPGRAAVDLTTWRSLRNDAGEE